MGLGQSKDLEDFVVLNFTRQPTQWREIRDHTLTQTDVSSKTPSDPVTCQLGRDKIKLYSFS